MFKLTANKVTAIVAILFAILQIFNINLSQDTQAAVEKVALEQLAPTNPPVVVVTSPSIAEGEAVIATPAPVETPANPIEQ